MGFFHMLSVNRELNGTVKGIHGKFHRLEDLINGHRGVDASNFSEVNTLISSVSRDVYEMTQRVERLDYAERASLLLQWTNGQKYSWPEWKSFALLALDQARAFVNDYRPGYYR